MLHELGEYAYALAARRRWLAGLVFASAIAAALAAQTTLYQFTPPTPAQQLAAIGPTQTLSPALRRALDPSDSFQPMPKPGDIDWLAYFQERGQTFAQFVQSQPRRPNTKRKRLYLQPLGTFPEGAGVSLPQLRTFTSAFFMIDVALLPPLDLIPEPHHHEKEFLLSPSANAHR